MNTFFAELGRQIYQCWQEENFTLSEFPKIAQSALEEQPPSQLVGLPELIREFLLSDEQPFQSASGFGQPELIVYDTPKFYIQILFWLDGTTDIHQHEFSGAFHVMAGSSIHSEFSFESTRSITAHCRIGNLRLKAAHLLETGSTVPITSGKSGIHSLFHLETPSVTVVVRTHSDPGTGPQFTYLPPHLAIDPLQSDTLTTRRKQLLDVLEQTSDPNYSRLVEKMVAGLDFERGFFILQNCMSHLRALGVWEEVWEVFACKHGQFAASVLPTLEEIIRRDGIAALRGSIEEIDHRFFLALLLNLERREDILEMISRKFPGDPLETILRWAEELMQFNDEGVWILDAEFPQEIGESGEVEFEELPVVFLSALTHFLLKGEMPQELMKIDREGMAILRRSFVLSSWRTLLV